MTTAQIGTLVLSGTEDADGDVFTFQEIEGWDSAPPEHITIPSTGTGDVIANSRYAARALTLRGVGRASTASFIWRARKKITDSVGIANTVHFYLNESTGRRHMHVIRAGEIRVRRQGPFAFEFEIPLLAPDPRKFNDAETAIAEA